MGHDKPEIDRFRAMDAMHVQKRAKHFLSLGTGTLMRTISKNRQTSATETVSRGKRLSSAQSVI